MAGSLSTADLLDIWKSVVDPEYARPLVNAGDGGGLEIYSQGWAQLERVSKAIHTTTQSMFIMPWSGQTAEPAGGARNAEVDVSVTRTARVVGPLVLGTMLSVEEVVDDASEDGAVEVATGRHYALTQALVFHAGDGATATAHVKAERSGVGYNNPLPETIRRFVQIGSRIGNSDASVAVSGFGSASTSRANVGTAFLVAGPDADVPIPDHIGQYVEILSGPNVGRIFRATAYSGPEGVNNGGKLQLALDGTATVSVTSGLAVGETIQISAAGPTVVGFGVVLSHTNGRLTYALTSGITGTSVLGLLTGTAATITMHFQSPVIAVDAGPTQWRVLDWEIDFGLSTSNALSPTLGRAPMLDALGHERAIDRASGEGDDSYRVRVWTPADVVCPNAIRRALNRSVGTNKWVFLEPGLSWEGIYNEIDAYDYRVVKLLGAGAVTGAFAQNEPVSLVILATGRILGRGYAGTIDSGKPTSVVWREGDWTLEVGATLQGEMTGATWPVDAIITSSGWKNRRYHTMLSVADFRGHFWVGLTPSNEGEFGCAYDAGSTNAFDVALVAGNFYDGAPIGWAARNRILFNQLSTIKAGGVSVDLFINREGPDGATQQIANDAIAMTDSIATLIRTIRLTFADATDTTDSIAVVKT